MQIEKIATYYCPLREKFGVPRQAGLAPDLRGRIVFDPAFRDANALRGLEGFDYLWLLWGFSANRPCHGAVMPDMNGHLSPTSEEALRTDARAWSPTVRPPRLGGNTAMGVFATRSPYRPNPIGLSSVKIEKVEISSPEGPVIHVLGADMMDGTPIYDIKPYVTYADSHPHARAGFVDATPWQPLDVVISQKVTTIPGLDITALRQILAQDPRPQYQRSNKEYGLAFGDYNIHFTVSNNTLTVISAELTNK